MVSRIAAGNPNLILKTMERRFLIIIMPEIGRNLRHQPGECVIKRFEYRDQILFVSHGMLCCTGSRFGIEFINGRRMSRRLRVPHKQMRLHPVRNQKLWYASLMGYAEMAEIARARQSADGTQSKAPLAQEAVGPNPAVWKKKRKQKEPIGRRE